MQSPYFLNSPAPSFMPPPGLMQALIARDQQMQEDAKSAGKLAGGLVSGVGGLAQGAANPEVFGPGTSKTGGAFKAAGMNMNAAMNGGGGFSALKMGTGGGGSGGAMNFKQFAAAGKAADGTFDFLEGKMPKMGDQEPNVFGMTRSQWKHAGTQDKMMWLDGVQDKQANELAMSKLAALGQEVEMRNQQMQAAGQVGPFMSEYAALTAKPEGQPLNLVEENPPLAVSPTAAFGAASKKYPLAPGAQQFDNTFQRFAQMGGQGGPATFFKPGQVVEDVPGLPGAKRVITGPNTAQFVNAPQNLIETKPDYDPAPGMMFIRRGKYWSEVEDPKQWERITEDDGYGNKRTRSRFVGTEGGGAPGTAPAGSKVEDAPKEPKQRKANTTYNTPKGVMKWTGTGWVTP